MPINYSICRTSGSSQDLREAVATQRRRHARFMLSPTDCADRKFGIQSISIHESSIAVWQSVDDDFTWHTISGSGQYVKLQNQ